MKKQTRCTYCILLLIFYLTYMMLTSVNVFADVFVPSVSKDTYVYDSADILSPETKQSVNDMLDKLEQDTSIEFAVITISSIDGLSIEDYSNQVYNELGIGKRDSDNGILLLIAADDSKVRLEIGRGLEGTLTDSICGRILDEHFVNHRSDGDYDAAVSETVSSIVSMELNNFNEADQTQDLTPLESLLLFFLAAVINIVILSWIFGCSPLDFFGCSPGDFDGFDGFGGSGGFSEGGSFGGCFSGGGGASR